MTNKSSNCKARPLVNELKPFKGNNVFAGWSGSCYVVYSYGYHFPLFVWDDIRQVWLENSDRYSVTTTKHKNQMRPEGVTLTLATTDELKEIIFELENEHRLILTRKG